MSLLTIFQNGVPYCLKSFFVWVFLGMVLCTPSQAQKGKEEIKEEAPKDTAAATEVEQKEKVALRMSFEAFLIDDSIKLIGRVRSKVGAKFQNTAGIEVYFYKNEISPGHLIGKNFSDAKGEAILMLSSLEIIGDSVPVAYWAAVQDNPDYKDVEETVSLTYTIMEMELTEEDSIKLVKVFVGDPDHSGQVLPLPGIECKVYIKRLFGLLQVGDTQTTDEEGNISVEFPHDIRGDESGNITIVAIIPNHEVLGNVEVTKKINWGIPVIVDDFDRQKELWSARSNSPILLIIIVNSVLIGIWGVIGFIFFEIFKINKLGKVNL